MGLMSGQTCKTFSLTVSVPGVTSPARSEATGRWSLCHRSAADVAVIAGQRHSARAATATAAGTLLPAAAVRSHPILVINGHSVSNDDSK